MSTLICHHDNAKLKPQRSKVSGIHYICTKCRCIYRLVIVTNDKDCYAKRYPTVNQPAPPKKRKK